MSIPGRPMPDNNTDYVKEAEARFNVQVRFLSRAKLHTSILVKGCEKEAEKVRDAARHLCFHMCGSVSIQSYNFYFISIVDGKLDVKS